MSIVLDKQTEPLNNFALSTLSKNAFRFPLDASANLLFLPPFNSYSVMLERRVAHSTPIFGGSVSNNCFCRIAPIAFVYFQFWTNSGTSPVRVTDRNASAVEILVRPLRQFSVAWKKCLRLYMGHTRRETKTWQLFRESWFLYLKTDNEPNNSTHLV